MYYCKIVDFESNTITRISIWITIFIMKLIFWVPFIIYQCHVIFAVKCCTVKGTLPDYMNLDENTKGGLG